MKSLLLPVLAVLAISSAARAQVGLSKLECDSRYKKPLTQIAGGTNPKFASYIYRSATLNLQIGFESDVAAYALVKKQDGTPFNDQELQALLDASGNASGWWDDGWKGTFRNWRRKDQTACATFDKGHNLFIVRSTASGLDVAGVTALNRLGL
jgi:hypothetical protein